MRLTERHRNDSTGHVSLKVINFDQTLGNERLKSVGLDGHKTPTAANPPISKASTMNRTTPAGIIGRGVAAGAAGGIAEIVWIFVYASATHADAASLAQGVTTATGLNLLLQGNSTGFGVAIHMVLAVTLGIVLAFSWTALSRRWPKRLNPYAVMPVALAGVWAINFLIVLPLVDADFVQIVPYPVSLISKLLFGFAAAVALSHRRSESTPIPASS